MPSNVVALTAVALGLVITGAAVGTGIQGVGRSANQEQPSPQPTAKLEQSAIASQLPTQPQATRYQPLVAVKVTPGVVIFNSDPAKDGAYLRSYPSLTQGAIEGVLPNGTKVSLGDKVGDFVAIATETGVKGWVHQTMLATIR